MIEINNLTTDQADEDFLKKVAGEVLSGEKKKDVDLSIALVGQGRIKELNRKYRGKNRTTDVLAFPDREAAFHLPSQPELGLPGLGEVVICLREVKKNAKRFGVAFEKELSRVLIHGLLHLLGYNHEESELKAKKMEEKQNYYLEKTFQSIVK